MWCYCDTDPVQKRDRLIWNGYVILLNFIIVPTVVLVSVYFDLAWSLSLAWQGTQPTVLQLFLHRKKVCNFGLGCVLNLHKVCWFSHTSSTYTVLLQIMLCLAHFFNVHKIAQTKLHTSTAHKCVLWSSFKCVSILSLAISKVQYTWGSLLLRPLPRFFHGMNKIRGWISL